MAHKQKQKSIAIVGAGSAGLAMLKTLLDFREHNSWNIVVFEERENVGGIWLPDPDPAPPPTLPRSPLYPGLRTNAAVPQMTYPNIPYPPGTHLFASHEDVQAYLVRYAHRYNLLPYIRLNHKVLNASWSGTPEAGLWNVMFSDHQNETHHDTFDHLLVATGNNRIPRKPTWPGQDEWLAGGNGTREIIHSVRYRHPEKYANKSILIIGDSPSGRAVAIETAPLVSKSFISIRTNHDGIIDPIPPSVIRKPVISHFTQDSIVFVDKTEIDVDCVILSTGYQVRKPFLDAGHVLVTDPLANNNTKTQALVTNTFYIFPLYRHIFSLSSMYPATALAFVGLQDGVFTSNCASDTAQSTFIAHMIRDPSLLPSRQQMLSELELQEEESRRRGVDPYVKGHWMVNGKQTHDYQDELWDYLKVKGAIADDGKNFVEEWRHKMVGYDHLREGWSRIEALGTGDEWVKGVSTEEQWSDLMVRVNAWQKDYEESGGSGRY